MFKKLFSSVGSSSKAKKVEAQLETELLGKVRFLEDADEQLISDLAAAVITVECPKGEAIVKEGDPGDSFFIIAEGSTEVTCKGELIAELGAGGCFGEGALLMDDVRSATVTASEDVTLFELKRKSFTELTQKYKGVRFRLKQLHGNREIEGMEKSIKENLLQNAPFLSGAGSRLITELSELLDMKTFAEGEKLIEEGNEGTHFFLVEKGVLNIQIWDTQIAQLGAGACVGEGSLLSKKPCSATVVAEVETSCYMLSRGSFTRIITRHPVFARRLKAIHEER